MSELRSEGLITWVNLTVTLIEAEISQIGEVTVATLFYFSIQNGQSRPE